MDRSLETTKKESLTLKWGTLKAWNLKEDGQALELLRKYHELGMRASAMLQRDTPEQKRLLCQMIDALDADTVYLDWDGKDVPKEEAKKYIMEYK